MAEPVFDFEEFVLALRRAVETARDSVAQQYLDDVRQEPAGTLRVAVARHTAGGDPPETVELDWSSLKARRFFTVTEFTVDLDCVVDQSTSSPDEHTLDMTVESWQPEHRPGIDRIRVVYSGEERLSGEIYLNDELIKVLD